MKRKLTSLNLFLLIFFLRIPLAFAGRVAGGDISYQYLGNNKYLITAKLLRLYSSDSMSIPQFGVFSGIKGNDDCGSTPIYSFKRVRISALTPVCSLGKSSCYTPNTKSNCRGIEEHVYQYTADFTQSPFDSYLTSSCDELTFYVSMSSREKTTNNATTSGFVVTATLNITNLKKCTKQTNNGPDWKNYGLNFLCCNQANYASYGTASNIDKDSFRFHLVPALSRIPNTTVTYNSPFTYLYPVTPYCVPPTTIKCTPNTKTNPPRGFYLDSALGITEYTPTKCDEIATIALEAIEYRLDTSGRYVEIARTRRETTNFSNDSCGYNKAPTIEGPTSNMVCEGNKICFSIYGKDETFTPYQTTPDTVQLYWVDSISGATFKIKNPKDREKEGEFCWQTKIGDASDITYKFTVFANDQHCPSPAASSRVFRVKVRKVFRYKPSIKILSNKCGIITATMDNKYLETVNYKWTINSPKGTYQGGNTDTLTSTVLPPEDYKIRLFFNYADYCQGDTFINITVDPHPMIDLGIDTAVCNYLPFNFTPNIQSNTGLFSPKWKINGLHRAQDTNLTLHLDPPLTQSALSLTMQDSFGCTWSGMSSNLLYYDKRLNINLPPKLNLGPDSVICFGDSMQLIADTILNAKYAWNTGQKSRNIKVKFPGIYAETTTDKNGCKSSDSVNIGILKITNFEPVKNTNWCQTKNVDSINLNTLILEDGKPIANRLPNYNIIAFNNDPNSPEIAKIKLINNYFPKNASVGKWSIHYTIKTEKCATEDTILFNIYPRPVADFTTNPTIAFDNGTFNMINKSKISDSSGMFYQWNFGRGPSDTSNGKEPMVLYGNNAADHSIMLIAKSKYGCMDSIRKTVQVLTGMKILLPPGFQISDKLVLSGSDLKSCVLTLTDANNKVVFISKNNEGLANFTPPPGIYFYQLSITRKNGSVIPVNGKIVLNN